MSTEHRDRLQFTDEEMMKFFKIVSLEKFICMLQQTNALMWLTLGSLVKLKTTSPSELNWEKSVDAILPGHIVRRIAKTRGDKIKIERETLEDDISCSEP